MGEKYPYLSSINFVDKNHLSENKEKDTQEQFVNYSCSSSDINVDDNFQDIDLDEFPNNRLDFRDILSWKIESDSMDVLPDVLEVPSTNKKTDDGIGSISSLSSLASSNDIISSSKYQVNKINRALNPQPKILYEGSLGATNASNQSDVNVVSQLSQFFQGKFRLTQLTPVKSTTCLILNDRPNGLPAKSPDEMRRHREEYNRLIDSIKRKERRQVNQEKAKERSKLNFEERQIQLSNAWRNLIIPNWHQQKTSKFVRHLWWEGIPTSLRDKVWRLCIPNNLKLTKLHYENFLSQMKERVERYIEMQKNETRLARDGSVVINRINGHRSQMSSSAYDLYISETVNINNQRSSANSSSTNLVISRHRGSTSSEPEMRQTLLNTIKLDVSRTFPHLNLFQKGGPHYDLLYQLLGAYACYRPDIGYVQGMSFLAAILILVMDVEDAFISFANIIEMPCHHALYGLDEIEFTVYVESFKLLLLAYLPQLGQHFIRNGLDVNIFLCDWLFTIFSRALSLETTLIVWDMFCRDGESALFRAGLGILRCYEMQLLNSDFEELASFLTGPMPESLTPAVLVEEMREILLSQSKFSETLNEVRSKLVRRN